MRNKHFFLLCWLLALALLPGLTALGTDTGLATQTLDITLSLGDDDKEMREGDKFRVTVDPADLSVNPSLDPTWEHILLLGTDTGNTTLNYGRTDAMMILSVQGQSGEIKLTSLVRDMLVDIPGMQSQNRINTANVFGGPLLAVKTVNEVLDLNITRYCSVNFSGFRDIIDHMGGVTLGLSAAEARLSGAGAQAGEYLLTGEQALHYVRIRELDNNFGRNERQQKLVGAAMTSLGQSGLEGLLNAVTKVLASTATNLTAAEVLRLVPITLQNMQSLHTLNLPLAGGFEYATTLDGASVVVFDAPGIRSDFHQFIYGSYAQ